MTRRQNLFQPIRRAPKKWPTLSIQTKQEMLRLRESGWRPAAIARKFNCDVRVVYHWTQDASVPRGEARPQLKRGPALHPLVETLYWSIYNGPPAWLVALRAEFSPNTLARWFRGEVSPRLSEITRVLDTIGVQIEWTLTPSKPSPSNTPPESPSSSPSTPVSGPSSTPPDSFSG